MEKVAELTVLEEGTAADLESKRVVVVAADWVETNVSSVQRLCDVVDQVKLFRVLVAVAPEQLVSVNNT